MKPIFGIDITLDKNNENINCDRFISKSISGETKQGFEEKTEGFNDTVKKSQLPGWIQIVKYILGLYAIIVAVGVLRALTSVNIQQAFSNAPVLIISGIVCAALWLGLHLYSKKKEKDVFEEMDAEEQVASIEEDVNKIYEELGVPQNAAAVDILLFKYKEKDGKIIPKTVGMQTCEFFNMEVKIFVRDGKLHLADVENLYSFDMSKLKSIETINKSTSLLSWNKEIGYDEERYKKHKISVNNLGNIIIKPYHILALEHNGEEWGLYFPCYELEIFEILTGLKAE
ncbi:MAG: hypothetical protein IJV68_00615 [Clostridia bacterium]|nr:hypothetical protein [Clostridia bacterium]